MLHRKSILILVKEIVESELFVNWSYIVYRSATEVKVPARGKAFVPTGLSIAIPEGTYARIGKSPCLYLVLIKITSWSCKRVRICCQLSKLLFVAHNTLVL